MSYFLSTPRLQFLKHSYFRLFLFSTHQLHFLRRSFLVYLDSLQPLREVYYFEVLVIRTQNMLQFLRKNRASSS